MSLYPKRKNWTLSEMRDLIKKADGVFVNVMCPEVPSRFDQPLVPITKEAALGLLGKDKPRPRFMAYGDGNAVVLG